MVADAAAIKQVSMDGTHGLVVDSGAYVHVCPKSSAHSRDFASTAGMLATFGLR